MRLLRRISRGGGGEAHGALRFWLLWEALNRPRSRPLRPDSVVRFRLTQYHGPAITLEDGVIVRPRDAVVDLHLDNLTLLGQARGGQFQTFVTLQQGVADLRVLATMLVDGSIREPVRAVRGLTPFAFVLRREGFELRPIRHTVGAAMTRMYMAGLLALYHPDGWAAVTPERAARWPAEIWMSVDRFIARVGPGPRM